MAAASVALVALGIGSAMVWQERRTHGRGRSKDQACKCSALGEGVELLSICPTT